MTSSERITAHGQKLLDALEQHREQWFTRKQVAALIGKKRLTPYDIDMLDRLAEKGHIRVQQEEGYSREGYRWLYGVFENE